MMKLRYYILALLLLFGLAPLILAAAINLPLVLERTALFYQKAYLQNLRADFRDLDQHLASRDEIIRLLAKLPGLEIILGNEGDEEHIDLARARYTDWINQMLADQRDIIQILFVDRQGQERFWLERHAETGIWHPTANPPEPPNLGFLNAALKLQSGAVLVSRIRVNPALAKADPRQLLTLQLASPVRNQHQSETVGGLLLMTIDVGGLAQFYRDTLWVNYHGHYLRPGTPISDFSEAFTDFPELTAVFHEGKLALSKSAIGIPYLWVPMFMTEDGLPLWVGRPVDSSPIADFRNTLMIRVLSIILLLVAVVLLMAHWIASRVEEFGTKLTASVRHILRDGQTVTLQWRGPREVRELSEQLTELSRTHAEHLASERQHTRQLEQSNRYKSEFLTNVSHELRTPLNAILLLSKLLAEHSSGLDSEQRRQAQVIHEAGSDLRTMIDNILDISRIEAGQVTVSLEWVELRPMLEELFALMEPLFHAKGIILHLNIANETPPRLYSDRDKLRQIIKNFLSNAVKFTHVGSVVIHAKPEHHANYAVQISVTDTGIGITPGKENIIFEAFQQADGSTRRRYGGTGLGLSISRELAGLLSGKITLNSTIGKGSCFTLILPLALNPDTFDDVEILESNEIVPVSHHLTSTTDWPSDNLENLDAHDLAITYAIHHEFNFSDHWVLLIERDVQTLLCLTVRLEALGLRVQTAADLDEAFETLSEEDVTGVVLLLASSQDLTVTCQQIATLRNETLSDAIPLIVLGYADDNKQAEYLAAGATAFIKKPVTSEMLFHLLHSLLVKSCTEIT
ncbi:hybrid sensor histidine kinase/response regulator [Thiospirillum jenense]|nr:ATP-binding protein [Thiospirillum jenense]